MLRSSSSRPARSSAQRANIVPGAMKPMLLKSSSWQGGLHGQADHVLVAAPVDVEVAVDPAQLRVLAEQRHRVGDRVLVEDVVGVEPDDQLATSTARRSPC